MQYFLLAIVMCGIAAFAMSATPALAQAWPQSPVEFVLPIGPGSGSDIGARLLADRLA